MNIIAAIQSRRKPGSLLGVIVFMASIVFASAVVAQNYYQEAEKYYLDGKYKSAVIQLKNLLIEEPKNTQGRILLGKTYIEIEDYDAAIKELTRAQELGDKSNEIVLLLANVYLRQGNYQLSIDFLPEEVLSKLKNKSEAYAILGHALIGLNRVVDAKEAFQKAINSGKSSMATVGLARISAMEGDIPNAHQLLDEVLSSRADSFDALLIKGQLLSAEEKHTEAIKYYDQAITLRKTNLVARLARAETHVLLNQLIQAQNDIEVAINSFPDLPSVNYLQARIFLAQDKFQLAQQSAEKVLNTDPDYRIASFILGAAHYGQNNIEQAKIHLEKFLIDQPVNIVGARLLAATYLKLNDAHAVVKLLEPQADYGSINDAGLLGMLGMAYLQVGNPTQASEYLAKALELNPELSNARIQLSVSQLMLGDTHQAINELKGIAEKRGGGKVTDLLMIAAHIKNNESDKALRLIQQRIDSSPTNPDYYHIKGLTHELLKQNEQAKEAFDQALKVDKNHIPSLLAMAKSAFKENNLALSKGILLQTLEIDSVNITSMLLLAQISRAEKDTKSELRWLIRARDKNKDAIKPLQELVNFYLQNNQLEKATSETIRYQSAHPESFPARSLLANVLYQSKEYADAEFNLRKLVDEYPTDISHRMLLAQTSKQLGNKQGALDQVNEILKINTRFLPALVMLAEVLMLENDLQAAKEVSETIRQLYPELNIADQLMADILWAENKTGDALYFYEEAFEKDRTANLAHVLHAIYMRENKKDQALAVLTRYLEKDPDNSQVRLKLASVYQQNNDHTQAIEQYEILLKMHPNNLGILNNLAWSHQVEGNQASLVYAEQAYKLAPENPDISDTYGWILVNTGDFSRGLEILQQAVSRAPTNPEFRYHLAVAFEKNDKKNDAIKELRRLLRDYQGFESENLAKQLLAHLDR